MNAEQLQEALASGKYEVTTLAHVQRANGAVEFFRVSGLPPNAEHEAIDEATYYAEGGAKPAETAVQREQIAAQARATIKAIEESQGDSA